MSNGRRTVGPHNNLGHALALVHGPGGRMTGYGNNGWCVPIVLLERA